MRFIWIFLAILTSCATRSPYPEHWWKPLSSKEKQWWEIPPQAAKKGQVVLSKRNELGVLSNFAPTPVEIDGKKYASMEGLWQSMKFPENKNDPRLKIPAEKWRYTRQQVEQMSAFKAKEAGDHASGLMQKLKINWVTYQGKKMDYRTSSRGEHFKLIKRAMRAKMLQNPKVEQVLKQTKGLELIPDHTQKKPTPPAWEYHKIWMELRAEL